MNEDNIHEYNVLGQKVRFRSEDEAKVSPGLAVKYVQDVASDLQNKLLISDQNQLAVLVALRIAQDKLTLEDEYKNDIRDLKVTAKDALKMIDEVVPLQ